MNLSKEELQRYSRHLLMDEFGTEAQLKLKNSKVLVVGAGGLGNPCLLYLAAAGVGFLGIADDDVVHTSNLQRQVLFGEADIGKSKSETAKIHLLAKNPLIEINTHPHIIKGNTLALISLYDIVIDGTDNIYTRYLLNDACVILNKPLIYGAIFKFEGQLSVFNYNDGPTYRCLYPQNNDAQIIPGCAEVGVLGVLPGIIGTMQAAEAIKIITGVGEPLSGKLLILNLLNNATEIFRFKLNPSNREIKTLSEYNESCEPKNEIDYSTLTNWQESKDIQLIDVREEYEFERYNIGGVNLPLSELEEHLNKIHKAKFTVVVCETGSRSLKAMALIKAYIPSIEIYNLKGGLQNSK
ncbi:MAG: HesA/MoeB/ThiF family protein [Pyrinomonadaceae bacterium]|nr:HesA/MoeB/ThiF family protein [Sphingobacteriaceae bacterium]